LDQVRDAIRLKHYSYRTEQAYAAWIEGDTSCDDDRQQARGTRPARVAR
jgi:hypothetical protein